MRVTVSPERLSVIPGVAHQMAITITNPEQVIAGYTVRILGADPSWVTLEESKISLFPDETRTILATFEVPVGLVAGERRVAVQVRELTPPARSTVEELVLVVPEAPSTRVVVDPLSLTMGRTSKLSLLVENSGNTTVTGWLAADDGESKLRTTFEPREVELAPGEHLVADMRVKGKRPFSGGPAVRQLNVHLVEGTPALAATGGAPAAPSLEVRGRRRKDAFAPPDPEAQPAAVATVLQKALLSRGPIGLVGLLAAVTVFAIVITLALSRIVGQSAQDRNLALEIAAAQDQAQSGGSSGLTGTVRELTSNAPAKGVAVAVYLADDLVDPVATLATGPDGSYRVNGLNAGDYKLSFRGAGFQPLWYPAALDSENAEVVKIEERNRVAGLDVSLSGEPALISGLVKGADVEDATVSLMLPATTIAATSAAGTTGAAGTTTGAADVAATAATTSAPAAPLSPDGEAAGAVVDTVPVGADGGFAFANVPSPSEYDVVVTKEGYATTTTRVDVAAGEERKGVRLNLRKGDGLVKGTVVSGGKALEGVTLTATSGENSVTTVSLDDGSFTLLQLPTPATYTLVATKDRYASQALSLTLGEGETLTGIAMSLGSSSTGLGGRVTLAGTSDPLGGVTVSVTDGTQVIQTASQSRSRSRDGAAEAAGDWSVSGLSIPGTYTVTFSSSGYATQTFSIDLDASGASPRVDAVMQAETGALEGRITQQVSDDPVTVRAVGGAVVELTSGTTTYRVTTASFPKGVRGWFRLEDVPVGSYTATVSRPGVRPVSEQVTIQPRATATSFQDFSRQLAMASQVHGDVVRSNPAGPPGAVLMMPNMIVTIYRASDYPVLPYAQTKTSEDGTYRFTNLDAPENYVLEVRRSRGGEPVYTKTITVDTSTDVSYRLQGEQR